MASGIFLIILKLCFEIWWLENPKNIYFRHLEKIKITTPQNSKPITHVSYYSVNQCWEVLTFWILEPMGKGRVYVPLTDGSQNQVLTLEQCWPLVGGLKTSKNLPYTTKVGWVFHENHKFFENIKDPNPEAPRVWNFQNVGTWGSLISKTKATQNRRFLTKSKNRQKLVFKANLVWMRRQLAAWPGMTDWDCNPWTRTTTHHMDDGGGGLGGN